MKVAFHSRIITERGSEGAMLDYARLNQSVLGNRSVICLPNHPRITQSPLLPKWRKRFSVILYENKKDLSRKLCQEGVEVVYLTKPGMWDGFLVPGLKNCVHSQFLSDEFHGDAYAYLSPWMSQVMTGREDSFVPFFVPRLESKTDLRNKLGISRKARVFGRHGGRDTFNIPFVRETVKRHADHHPEDHFVFLNTEPIRGTEKLANVHYLPATVDAGAKAEFLATCDAMLHARWHGETFGLAVAEFAVLGKPVITYSGSRERAHLEMLGEAGEVFGDRVSLQAKLENVRVGGQRTTNYTAWSNPAQVMEIFKEKFLN